MKQHFARISFGANDRTQNILVVYHLTDLEHQARVAQSVEHGTLNPRVVGSSPTSGAYFSFNGEFYVHSFFYSQLTAT